MKEKFNGKGSIEEKKKPKRITGVWDNRKLSENRSVKTGEGRAEKNAGKKDKRRIKK